MDNQKKETNLWTQHLEYIISIDKKLMLLNLIFLTALFVVSDFFIINQIENNGLLICIHIFLFSIVLFLIFFIHNRITGDIVFLVIVILSDLTSIYLAIRTINDDSSFVRNVYFLLCLSLIFINSKTNINRYFFMGLIFAKMVILVLIISLYPYNNKMMVIDLIMIIFSFIFIIIKQIINTFFFDYFENICNKNFSNEKIYKNMLNSMKYPLISINLKEKEIFTNFSFFNFFYKNFSENLTSLNFLFDRVTDNKFSDQYLSKLFENLQSDEQKLVDKLNENKLETDDPVILNRFKTKILILNKLFGKFQCENQSELIKEFLKFLNFFTDQIGSQENNFVFLGEYRIYNGISDKIVEIRWNKSIFDDNKEVIDIMFNDITEIKKKTYNNNYYVRMSYQKIAKNIKTPMKQLTLFLNKLISNLRQKGIISNNNNKENEICNYLNLIESQTYLVFCFINDLKDYMKETDNFKINLVMFDLREIVKEIFKNLQNVLNINQIKSEKIKLILEIDEKIPEFIKSDKKKIKQLLINILYNSLKFTYFGYIKLNIKLEKNESPLKDEIKFNVEDTGIGIKPEQMLIINELTKHENFVESGLIICKKIISLLGKSFNCVCENRVTRINFSIFNLSEKELDLKEEYKNNFTVTITDEQTHMLDWHLLKNKQLPVIYENENPQEEETQRNMIDFKTPGKISQRSNDSVKTEKVDENFNIKIENECFKLKEKI